MARIERSVHENAFDDGGDFNAQLYHALKASPWWMISLSAHVLLYVVSSLTAAPPIAKPEPSQGIVATLPPATLPDFPVDVNKKDDEVEPVIPDDQQAEKPDLRDDLIDAPEPETDNNSLAHSTDGNEGLTTANLDGPAKNPILGFGPGAGNAFGRPGPGGDRNAGRRGTPKGEKPMQEALDDALRWLAAHQSPDGGWESAGFNRWYEGKPASGPGPDGLGKATYDAGVTGLSLLAFLGAGYSNRGEHPYAKVVGNGLRYLKNIQDPEGCFGPRASGHFVYNHATASLAMVEAYGMTGSPLYRASAQRALDFIGIARNPYFAWRYGIKPAENDTSVTGWMMMALKSAKLVNHADQKAGKQGTLVIDEDAFDGIRTWVDKMTDPDTGRVGYVQRGTGPARPADLVDRFPTEKSESMTAVGVLARIFLGEDPRKSDVIARGAKLMTQMPPTWNPSDGSIDMYYWYYATLAMYQVGGPAWTKWSEAIKPAMVDTQRKDTDFSMYKGSWDPLDPWGADGGRVYSTAVMAMCLEVHYRYAKVFGVASETR